MYKVKSIPYLMVHYGKFWEPPLFPDLFKIMNQLFNWHSWDGKRQLLPNHILPGVFPVCGKSGFESLCI